MSPSRQAGQVIVFVALVLPMVLLPAAAFAVDAAAVAGGQARLEEAVASAAEVAAQQIDVETLRSGSDIALDEKAVAATVRQLVIADEPGATIELVTVAGLNVTVAASESVAVPLNFLGAPRATLRAQATARLALGYERPSSFLPFSVSTFCSAAGGISICSSSSRQRWG